MTSILKDEAGAAGLDVLVSAAASLAWRCCCSG
jgi:hypothetical protein